MKRKQESTLLPKVSALAVALAFGSAMPALAATKTAKPVKSTKVMQQRIDDLESQVKRLESMMSKVVDKTDAVATKADAADAKASETAAKTDAVVNKTKEIEAAALADADREEARAELNRVKVKVEALEDSKETSGLNGFKISGMIDPTYIYNRGRDSAGFNFLNDFAGTGIGKGTYGYDNSYFGQARLQVDRELESGSKFKLVLAPSKSAGGLYNAGSIVNEASLSIPIAGPNTRLFAGQIQDWTGYEYTWGDQNKLITHNLLFDFVETTIYTGVGLEFIRGSLDTKVMVANLNTSARGDKEKNPMVMARFDYSLGEFSGIGGAVQHGKYSQQTFDNGEIDFYRIRGPLTLDAQVTYGQWKRKAFNGGNAEWWGLSGLAAYKFTPKLEGIVRLDYLNNSRNGGGTSGTAFNCIDTADNNVQATCDSTVTTQLSSGDYRNGFGPSAADVVAFNNGDITSIRGANRSELSLGLDYSLYTNALIKAEFRFDHADKPTFYYVKDGSYRSNNQLFGLSTVLSF